MSSIYLPHQTLDLDAKRVVGVEEDVRFTELEARVLRYLITHRARVVSRDELLVEVWGYRSGVRSRAPDTMVKQLRRKIEVEPHDPAFLVSVYGEGYRWAGPGLSTDDDASWSVRQLGFFGRAAERADLERALEAGAHLVGVVGPAGSGASRLVEEVLASAEPQVLRLGHVDDPEALDAMIGRLDPERLVVLDDATPRALAAVVPRHRGSVWFTSWTAPDLPGGVLQRLGPMDPGAADALLTRRAEQARAPSSLGTDATRSALLASCAYLPGAIEIVARALVNSDPHELLHEIQRDPVHLWRGKPCRHTSAVIARVERLSASACRVLLAMEGWAAPVPREVILAACQARSGHLRELEEAGLVATWRDEDGHSRLVVPAGIRPGLPPADRVRQERSRLALHAVLVSNLEGLGPRDVPLLLAAAADPAIPDADAISLLWSLFDYFDQSGSYGDLYRWASARMPDPTHRRAALLSSAAVRLGMHEEAEAQGALATESDDDLVRLRGWSAIGSSRAIRGQTERAIPAFEAAASIPVDERAVRLRMSDNLAAAQLQLGDYARGIAILEESVRDARRVGGGNRLASVLSNLTNALAASGATARAIAAGREALLLHETLGDPRMVAFDHANLALALTRTTDVAASRVHIDMAQVLQSRFDDPRLHAWIALVELLVLCAEARVPEARGAVAKMLVNGRLTMVARGGGDLLDALIRLADDVGAEAAEYARAAMAACPPHHGARQLLPSVAWALARR